MDLGNRQGQMVPPPGLLQDRLRTGHPLSTNSDSLHVRINVTAITAMERRGISVDALVKEPLARYVVVHTDQVGRAIVLQEPFQLVCFDTHPAKVIPHGSARSYSSTEQVKR